MARELMTVRLEPRLRRELEAAARRRGLTSSAAVRLAIEAWLASQAAEVEARPYERIRDLVGSVDSGRARRTARTR